MGKRKYLSELEDVVYMTCTFINSVNNLFYTQMKQVTGETKHIIEKQKSIFSEVADCLRSFINENVESNDEKLFSCIAQIDESVFEKPKIYTNFVNVIDKIVDYHRCYKNPKTTRIEQYTKYDALNSAYCKWMSMIDFVQFKNNIRNIKLLVSKIFTR